MARICGTCAVPLTANQGLKVWKTGEKGDWPACFSLPARVQNETNLPGIGAFEMRGLLGFFGESWILFVG